MAWSHESPFHLHHVDSRVHVRHLPGEEMGPGALRKKGGSGCGFFFETYHPNTVANQEHPFMEAVFLNGSGLSKQDKAPCLTAKTVHKRFKAHNETLTWPPNSLDLIPVEHLWDVLDK